MEVMRPTRLVSVWLMALTLASCGGRDIGDSHSQADLPTDSVGGIGGTSSGGMTAGGTGTPGTGGGSGATGGNGAGGTTPVACPCTRRPDPGSPYLDCPKGTGIASMGNAGPSGGGFGFNSNFSVEIPPMALQSVTNFIATETKIPAPVDYVDFSPITIVAPQVVTLSPVTVTIRVFNKPGVPLTNLALYAAKDQYSPFVRVADSKLANGQVRGTVNQLGAYFAGYPKSPAQMSCP